MLFRDLSYNLLTSIPATLFDLSVIAVNFLLDELISFTYFLKHPFLRTFKSNQFQSWNVKFPPNSIMQMFVWDLEACSKPTLNQIQKLSQQQHHNNSFECLFDLQSAHYSVFFPKLALMLRFMLVTQ